jgi:hypothetical protein
LLCFDSDGLAIKSFTVLNSPKSHLQCEAAHENAQKDTDNFLVTVGES